MVQSIPTYATSFFLLPMHLMRSLNSMFIQFFWGGSEGNKKLCWNSWLDLYKPKYLEGMDFRDPEGFNLGLLAKQCWCLITSPSFLMAKLLQANIFLMVISQVLLQGIGLPISGRVFLKEGIFFLQGYVLMLGTTFPLTFTVSGSLLFMGIHHYLLFSPGYAKRQALELIDFNQAYWREGHIRHLFLHNEVEKMLKNPS